MTAVCSVCSKSFAPRMSYQTEVRGDVTRQVMAREKVKVIMKFPAYTGVFVFHCHNLEHEDDGMMLNYRIV